MTLCELTGQINESFSESLQGSYEALLFTLHSSFPQGKLIVLVTRDPRFLTAADRVLRIAHGGVVEDPR